MTKAKTYSWAVFIRTLFIVCLLSLFLPWFTYNASVMGYRYGFTFIKLFLLPMIVIAGYLFLPVQCKPLLVAAEFCSVANIVLPIISLGLWQEICNIKGGFHLIEGLRTALPGFWISFVLMSLFFLLFQCEFWRKAD